MAISILESTKTVYDVNFPTSLDSVREMVKCPLQIEKPSVKE